MTQVSGIEVRFSANTAPLEQGVAKAQGALTRFQTAANDAVPTAFGSRIQNVGYQVQDFAVQVASGTAATRAFAQQAPQLLSGFGTLGVVLGTVAAVAIPLAGNFIDLGAAAQALGDNIQTIGPYALAATAALAGFYAPAILGGIAATTTAIGVGLVGAIKAVTAAMMANPLGLLVAGVATAAVALYAFRDDVKQVLGVDLISTVKESVDWVIGSFVKASRIISAVWGNLGNIVGNAIVSVANLAIKRVIGLVNSAGDAINSLIELANRLPGVMIETFGKLDPADFELANTYGPAAAQAGRDIAAIMAEETGKGYVDSLVSTVTDGLSRVGSMFSGFGGAADAAAGKDSKADPTSIAPSQEPGRAFADRLEMIRDQFKTEREVLTEEYALNQQVLDNALLNKMIKEEEYYTLSTELARKHQADLAAIQQSRFDNDLAAAGQFFGSMASAAQAGGKRMLKVSKAFAAAQSIVATIQAAAHAMTDPTAITPIQKFANYAAVFAKGMSAVAAIRGVSDGGGGRGGAGGGGGGGLRGGGGGGGGGAAAAASPTTTFQFTLTNDPMGFGEKFARQFIDQLNSTQRNGGQIRGVIA